MIDIVTGERLEQSQTELWQAMKTWVLDNIDNSNLMTLIKETLDEANREVYGTTGTAKADLIKTSVQAMTQAFEDAGFDMEGVTTQQFAALIGQISSVNGTYILDSDGVRWTAGAWSTAVSHKDPVGVLITSAKDNIIVSHQVLPEQSSIDATRQWGTYNQTVAPMVGFTSINAEPYSGLMNTIHLMCWGNPDIMIEVPNDYTMKGSSTMTKEEVLSKELIWFDSASALNDILTPWATAQGTASMADLRTKAFVIPTDSTMTSWNVYYYSGTTSIAFGTRMTGVPKADTQGVTGVPAARSCFRYKAYAEDTRQWYLPSVYELFMIYLNKPYIDECMTALGAEQLKLDNYWSSVQNGTNYAFALSLSSGMANYYPKNSSYRVRAVTRL